MADQTTEWEQFARSRLCKILGEQQGNAVMAETLAAAGLQVLDSPEHLQRFAEMLKPRGGLLGATGGLLSLHAAIHAHRPQTQKTSDDP